MKVQGVQKVRSPWSPASPRSNLSIGRAASLLNPMGYKLAIALGYIGVYNFLAYILKCGTDIQIGEITIPEP